MKKKGLSVEDYQKVIIDWNKTEKDFPKDKTIHQLFEEQVKRTPNNIAVVFEDQQLTYKQLNAEANQLARYIRKQNPGELVAICMDRSLEMIVAILGILKAGCAYVPIDPKYPQERIDYILEDTKASLVLDSSLKKKPYQNETKNNLTSLRGPHDLAYVIYTSGTTGRPKGVMVEASHVIRLVKEQNYIEVNPTDRMLFSSSIAFDAATFEIWGALLNGARLMFISQETLLDTDQFDSFLQHHGITVASLIASLFNQHALRKSNLFKSLRYLIVGGEAVSSACLYQVLNSNEGAPKHLLQAYGPTENTTFTTSYELCIESQSSIIPIGRPLNNTQIYVLDQGLEPVPVGAIGELYIGGAGLARGYLNQPELTKERFINNPFAEGRIYKTGDLVRYLPDGNLEYMGRNDFQVKIRGYRVEPGEIESALSTHPDIKQVAVITHDGSLIAYYVGQTKDNLNNYLSNKLPQYMIPSAFIVMESFPLTINGKLDRKALPLPDFNHNKTQYIAPRDEMESITCQIWQQALTILQVGIDDDFFSLGGHSILAIHVTHEMSRALKRNVLVADIFKYRTIANLCTVLKGNEALQKIMPIKDNPSPLSFAQERLWFIEQYEGGTDAYHIPVLLRREEHLIKSLQCVIQRHAILRTRFIMDEKGQYLQEVHNEPLPIEANVNPDEFVHRIFDLTQGHPLRAGLYDDYLLLVFHHIAFDEWSGFILEKELQNADLPPLEIQYKDFAVWQRALIESQKDTLLTYWKTRLADITPLQMPTDYPRPVNIDYQGASVAFTLPNKLRSLSEKHNVTPYAMLLAGLAITLSRYTGQGDLIIGTPVANRQHPQLEHLIGFFVNTLVLRIQLDSSHTLSQCIRQIQEDLIEAQLHQDMPFEKLVDELCVERDTSRHPIFQVMYMVQYSDVDDEDKRDKKGRISFDYETAKFDLLVSLCITPNHIRGTIQYATSLFRQESIERLVIHYQQIASAMLTSEDKEIGDYPILTKAEYQQIVIDWNQTEKDYPKDKTIHQFFEEQAVKTPNNIAAVFKEQQLTYQELNEEANQLARYILKQKPGELIAICMDRSLDMIIAILGILKAGCAYAPIDPNCPAERIDYILEDTKARLVLDNRLKDKPYKYESKKNLACFNAPDSLAYVIFTSGSTGTPKGVCISHQSALNTLHAINQYFNVNEKDKILALSELHFDLSVYDIFGLLIAGGQVIIPSEAKEPKHWHALIRAYEITLWNSVPALMQLLLENTDDATPSLRAILLSGDKISLTLASQIRQCLPQALLMGLGGATEGSIWSIGYLIDVINPEWMSVPYGRALPNQRMYILDTASNPCPMGARGEICIGGAGVALGYWNNEERTREQFIQHKDFGRIYRTGDLGAWHKDGYIQYHGRNDFQVKIHGYRIEPGEIEAMVTTHPGINQVLVVVHDAKLIAYYTGQTKSDLHDYLSYKLPEYMIPSAFIAMESFPLTINGKLDRKALPIPDYTHNQEQHIAPRNNLEVRISKVWQSVLKLKKMGIQDDFFRLGGDSIQSIQVSARLQREGIAIHVKDIFTCRTIQKLAEKLSINKPVYAEQGLLIGSFALLPIQQWFFHKTLKHPGHWNQSFIVQVPELSVERLTQVLPQLIEQHDVLRLRFKDGQQIYTDNVNAAGIKTAKNFKSCTAWQSHFNLEEGPLWQMGYIEGGYLFFAAHHLIIDAVSWRILIDDMQRLYEGGSLGLKSSSYRQWVAAIQRYPDLHPDERDYWASQVMPNPHIPLTDKLSFAVCELDERLTQQLLTHANQAYHTEINDLLLTALAYALYDWSRSDTNSITLEGHGREAIDETLDVSRTIGWFTTQYPVKLTIKDNISDSIQHLKESLRSIPNKGIGFGAFFGDAELPGITFNYLGQFDSQTGEWQLANKPSGQSSHADNAEAYLLSVNGMILNHRLQFNIATHTESAAQIGNAFKSRLTQIIQHCATQVRSYYTPSDFNTITLSRALLDQLQANDLEIEAIYKANSLQQGFIYHALSQVDDDAYRVQLLLDYHNPIYVEAYRQAWELAIQTYPILRTYFNWDEGIIQIITQQGRLDFTYHETMDSVEAIQQADRNIAFDLQKPTQLRIHLMKHADDHYTLLKSEHHIISDGWSGPILLNKVHGYYQALIQNISPQPVPDSAYLQAQDYIAANRNRAKAYWDKQLQSVEPNDLNAILSHTTDLDQVKIVATSKERTIQLALPKNFLQQQGLTLYVLAQFAWHKLIHTYTRDERTIVGTTVSGRALPIPGIESSVGLYINTLPLVIDWTSQPTILEQLKKIEIDVLAINEYSYAELATLQKEGKRLFHSLFVFENYPVDEAIDEVSNPDSLQLSFRGAHEKLDYPLCLIAYEGNQGLIVKLKYDGAYLDDTKAEQLLAQFKLIFDQVPEKHTQPHHALNLLTQAEYQQMVIDWNQTEKDYPKDKMIHQLFEEQVKKTPNNIAAVFEDQRLTYQQLNAEANQLARYIRKQNPGELVAICLDRSLEMIVAILGILKAGCAYVPIDPKYPQERIDYILEDTKASLVLDSSLKKKPYQNETKNNLTSLRGPHDLAYVIYTSGTTGVPKGVSISHQNVLNTLHAINEKFNVNEHDKILTISELHFDLSVYDILGLLIAGGQVVIPVEAKEPKYWHDLIQTHQITLWNSVPALMQLLLDEADETAWSLRAILLSGDTISLTLADQVRQSLPEAVLMSLGGATEGSIWSIWYLIEDIHPAWMNVPYGRALPNQRIYVLDTALNPCPMGSRGEICIGGAGVALGYWNNEEKTQQQFIQHTTLGRIYRTGDLGAWHPEGYIQYHGRNDFQVKIRGFRIELDEIENALSTHPDIKKASVVFRAGSLIAYYAGEKQDNLSSFLSHKLPEYMIPSVFTQVECFPLTMNGKLDRNALPLPDFTLRQRQYVAPRDEIESIVCLLWQKILNLPQVGIEDDFFSMGGHSILAIQVTHKMSRRLKRNVLVADIFKHRTIAKICEGLKGDEALQNIRPVKDNPSPLSYAQERLWFIEQYEGGTDDYHVPMLLRCDDNLIASLQRVIQRHAILRTRFVLDDNGQYLQEVHNEPLPIEENINPDEFVHRIFDLRTDHPLRAGLYDDYLLIVFHHIAFDAWSGVVLEKELKNVDLPPLEIQYKDFAVWQRALIEARKDELVSYWKTRLANITPLQIPTDYPRPVTIDHKGASVKFTLSNELKALSEEYNVTHYATLLAGLAITLSRHAGQCDLTMGTSVVNRQHPQLEHLIGFFVNTLVLRIQLDPNHTLSQCISQIQDNLIEAQLHQDLPFGKLVDELNVERDTSRHPVFQVMYEVQYADKDDSPEDDSVSFDYMKARFDLSIFLRITPSQIKGEIVYATSLFKQESIERLIAHYQQILTVMLADKDKAIGTYSILTHAEYQQIVIDWNQTEKDYLKDKTIHQLFEEQVFKTPDHVAVIFNGQQHTYQELNDRANQLAHYLRKQGYNGLIAICMDRSLEMIVAIFGIFKAGLAYVPIDPNYPLERIQYILGDSSSSLLLTQPDLLVYLQQAVQSEVLILNHSLYQQESTQALNASVESDNLAYVIYTSGTTGKPKGVMVEHQNVVNYVNNVSEYISEDIQRFDFSTNLAFDLTVTTTLVPLLIGKTILVYGDKLDNVENYIQHLQINKIDFIKLTPSYLSQALSFASDLKIKQCFLGGEAVSEHQLKTIQQHVRVIYDEYGPTETTVGMSLMQKDGDFNQCIGKPYHNYTAYVLDPSRAPLPIGAVGELYIGGAGLARGYLNQPKLTNEHFIPNPFGGGRLFKTGDLVRWLADGNLEYLGRNDFQVKIRGYRVELGEVENALAIHPGIKHCVVFADDSGLVAYYTGQAQESLSDYLRNKLPEYMIPYAFIAMESLPLTINGKLDRNALPLPDFESKTAYVAPRTSIEYEFCSIWQRILGVDRVGIDDDFFGLGGHSMLAVHASHQMNKYVYSLILVSDIFRYKNIRSIVDNKMSDKTTFKQIKMEF